MRLANRRAVVTGAGSGIGRALARSFARQGARSPVIPTGDAAGPGYLEGAIHAGFAAALEL